jgi:ligand-binding SRPBCC domain-containing protein
MLVFRQAVAIDQKNLKMIEVDRCSRRRGLFRLSAETVLPAPIDEVFAFFSKAENLEAITPPWLHFQIVTPTPISMKAGALIDYRLRLRGLPIRWRTEISDWEPPFRFVDRQLRGPHKSWEHTHEFEETATGTTMRDKVEYSVFGGAVVERLFVRSDLKKIFTYRNEQINIRLGGGNI